MKLLFDQNIAQRLIPNVLDLFPNSAHVNNLDLSTTSDEALWNYAQSNDFVLVTTDAGFFNYSILSNKTLKVIHVKGEAITTNKLEWVLRVNAESIEQFVSQDPSICLTIQT
jgi:predicted nuclease of predicted toxin-antitoxin system